MDGNKPLIGHRYRRVPQPTGLKASFHYHLLACFPYRFHGQDILAEGFLRPGESYPLSPKPLPYGARSWALDMTTSRITGCFATLLVGCLFNCCTNVVTTKTGTHTKAQSPRRNARIRGASYFVILVASCENNSLSGDDLCRTAALGCQNNRLPTTKMSPELRGGSEGGNGGTVPGTGSRGIGRVGPSGGRGE